MLGRNLLSYKDGPQGGLGLSSEERERAVYHVNSELLRAGEGSKQAQPVATHVPPSPGDPASSPPHRVTCDGEEEENGLGTSLLRQDTQPGPETPTCSTRGAT